MLNEKRRSKKKEERVVSPSPSYLHCHTNDHTQTPSQANCEKVHIKGSIKDQAEETLDYPLQLILAAAPFTVWTWHPWIYPNLIIYQKRKAAQKRWQASSQCNKQGRYF